MRPRAPLQSVAGPKLSKAGRRRAQACFPVQDRLHRIDMTVGLELARGIGAVLSMAALAATFEDGLIAQVRGDGDGSELAGGLPGL